jgi:hypothetical protein
LLWQAKKAGVYKVLACGAAVHQDGRECTLVGGFFGAA